MAFDRKAYNAHWMAALRARWRAVGGCSRCGAPSGKYERCLACRRKYSLWWKGRQKHAAGAATTMPSAEVS